MGARMAGRHMSCALSACVLMLCLGACTLPKKAPMQADAIGQAGGTASTLGPSSPSRDPMAAEGPIAVPPKVAIQAPRHAPAVTPPQPLERPAPAYPSSLSADGMEGRVLVRYTVDASGRARDVQIVQASHPLFAKEVQAALARWRFDPARDATGHAVPAPAQQSFQFRTQD